MEDKYFNELRYVDKEPVCTWQYIKVIGHNVRVYFKAENEIGLGFIFYAVMNAGHVCVPETENKNWHPDYTMVQCMYRGIAYFDGIRHLYMGDESTDNVGYHYYARLEKNIETLKVIRELEKKYCRDYE